MKTTILLSSAVLAFGCVDDRIAVEADGGTSDQVQGTFARATVDRCRVTSVTCSAAVFSCTGLPPGGDLVDQWRRVYPVDASGARTYTINNPWNGRYATGSCPPGAAGNVDAGFGGCEVELDDVTLPATCNTGTQRSEATPVSIPGNDPAGIGVELGVIAAPRRPRMLLDVDVYHPNRGDLGVRVLRPNGGAPVTLHDYTGGGLDDLQRRYIVDSPVTTNGRWTLIAADGSRPGTGIVRSWSLRPVAACAASLACDAGLTEYCVASDVATMNRTIPDEGAVEATVDIAKAGLAGRIRLSVDIEHGRASDLEISLRAPGGRLAKVWERAGGSSDFVSETFEVDHLAGVPRSGTWRLQVRDRSSGEVGTLRRLELRIEPACF
jgi:subtilisin-like proprotein convertase family protein